MAGIFLLMSLVSPMRSLGFAGFGSATLTPTSSAVCGGSTLTFTGTFFNGACSPAADWTANYIVDSSPDNFFFYPATGASIASAGPSTPTFTFTTAPYAYPGAAYVVYYRIRMTGITNNCAGAVGTYNSASIVVSVNPAPTAITGSHTICLGTSTTYSNSIGGGAWSSSNTGIATIGAASGVANGVSSGTATITYAIGSCVATYPVTVNASAGSVTGPSAICLGTSGTFNTTSPVGTWSSSDTTILKFPSSITSAGLGVALGTATVTYTKSNGCTATKLVTVQPNPDTIIGTHNLCLGNCTTFYDSTAGGSWSSSNSTIALVTGSLTGAICGNGLGTATISYKLATGCYSTYSVTVNPNPAAITGPTAVCVNSNISLNDLSSGGSWTSSNTAVATVGSSTGSVTGVSPGTVTITYSFPTGCFRTYNVTVNALPAAITVSGTGEVCQGSTLTLTDATTGGTWLSGNTGVASIGSSSGILTAGPGSGTVNITYTITSTGCYTVTSTPITVNPLPAVITGNTPVCIGNSFTLGNATAGGTWASANTAIATVGSSSGIVTGAGLGTTTITYTLSTGCFRTADVTINALPSGITGTLSICVGNTTTLANASTGGTWSSGNTAVATVSPGTSVYLGVAPGTAVVSYTLSTGCYTTAILTVNANPGNIAGGTATLCVGDSVTLTNGTSGGTWSSSNTAVGTVNASTGVVTAIGAGTTTVTYMLSTGCYATTTITVNALPSPITGPSVVCVGSPITLANAIAGGTWSSSNTSVAIVGSSSGIVFGISGGVVTIIYTPLSGCRAFATVTVNPVPAPLTGVQVVCVNSTTTFSDTTAGGTWSSSNTSVATVNSAGVITGVSAGTAAITYTLSTGCFTRRFVTVNPLPLAISGPLSACLGTMTTLSDANPGGTWISSDTSVATIDLTTGGVLAVAVGTTTITYTLPTSCATTTVFTVYPVPAPITGIQTVCVGLTTTFSDTTAGGTWSSSNSNATISASGVITGSSAGTAIITYALGPCVATRMVTVNPLPAAISGPSTVCEGGTITFADVSSGGTWSSSTPAVGTIGVGTGEFIAGTAGTTTITYTLPTGCITTKVITVNPLPAPITGPGSVCAGSTITLADATSGGTWSSGTPATGTITSTTGVFTGIAAGTTTITYQLATTSCFVTAEVSVNPLPDTISGSLNACIGAMDTLTNSVSGGTWASSNTAVATIGITTGILTGMTTGTTIITYTLPTGCYVTSVVTVNPLGTGITGSLAICLGDSTLLSNATPGGSWSSENTLIATVDTGGMVRSVTAGSVTITYTLPTGCYTTTVVTVNPIPPVINGTFVMCVGGCVTLTDTTTGGTWTSTNTTIASAGSASGVICGVSAGIDTIIYTLPTTCHISTVVTVHPLPNPISGVAEVCYGLTTTLFNTTLGGTWSSSNGTIVAVSGMGDTVVCTGVSVGSALVTYTLATGCYTTILVTVHPLPSPIGGTFVICQGSSTILFDADPGGTWLSSNTSVATIGLTTGVLSGVAPGIDTITYTLATGCSITQEVTVNPLPSVITGPSTICLYDTVVFSDSVAGGTWSSTVPGVGTIDPVTGQFTGLAAGVTIISYTLPTGCATTHAVTVNPLPDAITGLSQLCFGYFDTLTTTSHGGTWSSSDTTVITVTPFGTDSVSLHGVGVGSSTISYTLPTGCYTVFNATVNPLPKPIVGPDSLCVGSSADFEDSTVGGNWTNYHLSLGNIDGLTGLYNATAQGIDTIRYTLSTGCYVTHAIRIDPLPTPIFGVNELCAGSTTTLFDTTGGGIWTNTQPTLDTFLSTNDTMVVIKAIGAAGVDTIFYTLTATGCATSIQVTVHPLPVLTVTPTSTFICRGSNTSLTATGAGVGGTYTWSPATGLSCTNCANPVANPTVTTTYTVTGVTVFGCDDTAVVTVMVDTLLNHIQITGRDSICAGTCDTLIASGFTWSPFSWHPAAGLSCTICDTTIACPDVTRTYWAVAVDSIGCRDSVSFTVYVRPLPIMSVDPNPATICRGQSTTLTATSSVPGTHFSWFPNAFLNCDTCAVVVASDTQNLVYILYGTTPAGCTDSIRVPVSILDNTTNTISPDTIICRGESVHLLATAVANDGSRSDFYWTPGSTLDNQYIPNPTATPTATTTYTVTITPNRCFTNVLTVTVGVAEYPQISISALPSTSVIAGTVVTLNATITNGVTISEHTWSPAEGLSCVNCYLTHATPTHNTTYTFTAVSNYGCSATDDVTITLRCDNTQIFIPNTFTPNGDGMNDRFFISGKGVGNILSFRVFNRWGELMYEAHNFQPNDPSYGWDGTYQGIVLPPDVFYYTVEAICELGGDTFKYKGDISIVR